MIGQVAAALDVGAPGASGTSLPEAPGRSGSVHSSQITVCSIYCTHFSADKLEFSELFSQKHIKRSLWDGTEANGFKYEWLPPD
jgi:hypothetical protein